MKLTETAFVLCCLFCLQIGTAGAAGTHAVKGVVITPDGTVVPEFSIVVRQVSDKPHLLIRKHFKNGEFVIGGLDGDKYQLQVASPLFMQTKLYFDFTSHLRPTDYSIVILRPYRSEARLTPGGAYSASTKTLQQKVPHKARAAYLKGVELHREGKLEAALIEYGRALRSHPRYLEALTDIGTIFLLYNRPQTALMFLRRAKDLDKCNPVINLNIAMALLEQGDDGGALKLLRKILKLEPRMARAQYLIGKIHYSKKKYEPAETYTRQALESDPKLLDAWVLMMNLSLDQQNYGAAREALTRIREAMTSQTVTKFIDEQLSALGG